MSQIRININESTRNVIATTAIGKDYLEQWERNSRENWIDYAQRHNLGIVVFLENVDYGEEELEKGPSWQKLLLPELLFEEMSHLQKVALIDTDVVFSPIARNIFLHSGNEGIGAISQIKNLPFDLFRTKRHLAFLRNKRFDEAYPLDSELFAGPEEFFANRGLPSFDDYFCGGVFVVNDRTTSSVLRNWYPRISKTEAESIWSKFGTWEEPYLNVWAQGEIPLTWMEYQFHGLWTYELASNHQSAFKLVGGRLEARKHVEILESALLKFDLLHFAGSWHETGSWDLVPATFSMPESFELDDFKSYLQTTLVHTPRGKIVP